MLRHRKLQLAAFVMCLNYIKQNLRKSLQPLNIMLSTTFLLHFSILLLRSAAASDIICLLLKVRQGLSSPNSSILTQTSPSSTDIRPTKVGKWHLDNVVEGFPIRFPQSPFLFADHRGLYGEGPKPRQKPRCIIIHMPWYPEHAKGLRLCMPPLPCCLNSLSLALRPTHPWAPAHQTCHPQCRSAVATLQHS